MTEKKQNISFWFDEALISQLDNLCLIEEKSRAEVVEKALTSLFEEYDIPQNLEPCDRKEVVKLNYPDVYNAVLEFSDYVFSLLSNVDIYLFGSYAKGCPRDYSDIDVGIIGVEFSSLGQDKYLDINKKLCIKANDINSWLEFHIVSKKHDIAGFSGVIERTGILIASNKCSEV